MDHQDIADLMELGNFEKALELRRERARRNGVSKHDAQVLDAMEKKIRAAAVTVKIITVPPVAKKAKPPRVLRGRTSRRKE